MQQDAERFFATLDTNHDGEIDPDEITHYEQSSPQSRLAGTRRVRSACSDPRTGRSGGLQLQSAASRSTSSARPRTSASARSTIDQPSAVLTLTSLEDIRPRRPRPRPDEQRRQTAPTTSIPTPTPAANCVEPAFICHSLVSRTARVRLLRRILRDGSIRRPLPTAPPRPSTPITVTGHALGARSSARWASRSAPASPSDDTLAMLVRPGRPQP